MKTNDRVVVSNSGSEFRGMFGEIISIDGSAAFSHHVKLDEYHPSDGVNEVWFSPQELALASEWQGPEGAEDQ